MAELKTIKVTEEDFDKLLEAKRELLIRGVNSLPDQYRDLVEKELKQGGNLTNGFMVNIGTVLLLELLSSQD